MPFKLFISTILFFISFESSFAGVVVGGTRVIYDENKKEASISVNNSDSSPYLIQSWIENDTSSIPSKKEIPFVITPPLFKLNGNTSNSLRIIKTENLPGDRESVYWINIKSIPTSDPNAKNQLNISVNTRIKLFYRPEALSKTDASQAYEKITFSRKGDHLYAKNPTPFYISLNELQVNGKTVSNPGMISPFSEKDWAVFSGGSKNNLNVKWSAINDYGGKSSLKIQAD